MLKTREYVQKARRILSLRKKPAPEPVATPATAAQGDRLEELRRLHPMPDPAAKKPAVPEVQK